MALTHRVACRREFCYAPRGVGVLANLAEAPPSAVVGATGCSSAWLERCVRDAEVAGSNPVTPIIRGNGPFGENVEGLSYCGNETYTLEPKVQTHDFE